MQGKRTLLGDMHAHSMNHARESQSHEDASDPDSAVQLSQCGSNHTMTDRDKLTYILPVRINIVAWFVRSLQKPLHWRSQRYVAITDSN